MSQEDPYFQFPLSCLAYGEEPRQRLQHVISYSIVHAGATFWERLDATEKQQWRDYLRTKNLPSDFLPHAEDHVLTMIGAAKLNVRFQSVQHALKEREAIRTHVKQFASRHGPDPLVRLRADFVWDVLGKKGLTYRELAVFAAIVSSIGSEPYRLIRRPVIQHRMLGYKSAAVMRAELKSREDGEGPLTTKQLRITVEELHERGFFVKVNPSKTTAYYSIRLSREELCATLPKGLQRSADFRAMVAAENAKLQNAVKPLLKQKHRPGEGPRAVQDTAGSGASTGPGKGPL